MEDKEHDSECTQPFLTISQAVNLKENLEENMINCCITNLDFLQHLEGQSSHNLDSITNLRDFYEHSTSV